MSVEQLARTLLDRGDHRVFGADRTALAPALHAAVHGKSFLVLGGAGSIGSATLGEMLSHGPSRVDVVDSSENGLAELARDLRSSGRVPPVTEVRLLCLDIGSPLMHRLLRDGGPYDGGVLSFAAMKHVRSEKDPHTLLRLLKINVLDWHDLMGAMERSGPPPRLFTVSTDKAADPTSLMGASKRVMEAVHLDSPEGWCTRSARTSARFANVAFSAGSLLEAWTLRLLKHQPLACPAGARRFFVTPCEAGSLCLLSALGIPAGVVAVPTGPVVTRRWGLLELAEAFLLHNGLEPRHVTDEEEARSLMTTRGEGDPYPLLVTPLDTAGEKEEERFVGRGEDVLDLGLGEVAGLRPSALDAPALEDFLSWLAAAVAGAFATPSVDEISSRVGSVVPDFHHRASSAHLDQRM